MKRIASDSGMRRCPPTVREVRIAPLSVQRRIDDSLAPMASASSFVVSSFSILSTDLADFTTSPLPT